MTRETSKTSSLTSDDEADGRLVKLYIDDDTEPFAELSPPVSFVLDSTKLIDGKHQLKVVATTSDGKEGITEIPFEVRNGPAISVVGLKPDDVVENLLPITINAYGSENEKRFIVTGSETPKAIPAWVWVLLISFIGWGFFYVIQHGL